MTRRVPIIPTLIVLAAVATMIGLGVWQLQRLEQKETALARYRTAEAMSSIVPLGNSKEAGQLAYRKVSTGCRVLGEVQLVAGRNSRDEPGWSHVAVCSLFGFDVGRSYSIVLGWSRDLRKVEWEGGDFTGTLVPGPKGGVKMPAERHSGNSVDYNLDYHIVADPPLAGLEANAAPDPEDIPNNHLAYAWQWFFFAVTALVIYALALRRRWKERAV